MEVGIVVFLWLRVLIYIASDIIINMMSVAILTQE